MKEKLENQNRITRRSLLKGITAITALSLIDIFGVSVSSAVATSLDEKELMNAPLADMRIKNNNHPITFVTKNGHIPFHAKEVELFVWGQDSKIDYYKTSDLPKFKINQVYLETEQGEYFLNFDEDDLMKLSLSMELTGYDNFDCAAFVKFMNNRPFDEPFYFNNWHIDTVYDEYSLQMGDTVLFADCDILENRSLNRIRHFAIYLGEDLYISKLGPEGKLMVMNLEDLKKIYASDYVFTADYIGA